MPEPRQCSIDGCNRVHYARGWCGTHYSRWFRRGDPLTVTAPAERRRPPSKSAGDRFWAKVERRVLADCWEWTGSVGRGGYGHFALDARRGHEKYADAHRVAYELLVGPVPAGLVLDHTCSNRRCVNPAHLEPVTQAENLKRARERKLAHTGAVIARGRVVA